MRGRRRVGVSLATLFVLSGLLGAGASVPARGDTKAQLNAAKAKVAALGRQIQSEQAAISRVEAAIRAEQQKIASLQAGLNVLAGRIDTAQNQYDQTRSQIEATTQNLTNAESEYQALRRRLEQRARLAYEEGGGGYLGVILGSDSFAQLSDRLAFLDSLSRSDIQLANSVQNRANSLRAARSELHSLEVQEQVQLANLQTQQAALTAQFQGEQAAYSSLASQRSQLSSIAAGLDRKRQEMNALVTHLAKKLKAEQIAAARRAAEAARRAAEAARRAAAAARRSSGSGGGTPPSSPPPVSSGPGPFFTCPVDGPHAYTDDFGAIRYTTNPPHLHAGIDIMAPMGTPIVAPFNGVATNNSGGLGGLAVIVRGAQGYVYNAHLSRMGTLGSVRTGTIVGYVGNTGDAAGGATHDHFEWHPNVIPAHPYVSAYGATVVDGAIDSFPFLNAVC